jgi:hypothetical protein
VLNYPVEATPAAPGFDFAQLTIVNQTIGGLSLYAPTQIQVAERQSWVKPPVRDSHGILPEGWSLT